MPLQLEIKDVRAVLELLQELRGLVFDPGQLRQRLLESVCRLVGAASGSALLTQLEADGKRHRILLAVSTPTAPQMLAAADPELLERCLDAARRRLRAHRRLVGGSHKPASAARGEPGRTARVELSQTAAIGARELHHCLLSPPLASGGFLVTGLLLRRNKKQNRPFSLRDQVLVELAHSAVGPLDPSDPIFAGSEILELTPRQYQTLHALIGGQGEKQIAREMGLSPNTVHHHIKAIYRHFGVSSRGELAAHWLRARQA